MSPFRFVRLWQDTLYSLSPDWGWKGISNGDLLVAAESEGFDAFVLADKNLRYQQNLVGRRITIVELWTNHRPTLERHFLVIADAVNKAAAGDYILVTPA